MKPEDIITELNINHKWVIWEPKKGSYAGMTKYICLVKQSHPIYEGEFAQCIVAGFKREDKNKPHLHLGSITQHQLEKNTKPLDDPEIRNLFEGMFKEYKKSWEEKQVLKKAKAYLSQK